MQEENFGSILTNIGKAKVANATLLNGNIALKTLKVGDSNGTYYNPTEDQAELKNTVYECAVGAIKIDTNNPNWITVETLLPGNIGGFTIREVGLFDADGDMIVVGKYPETYKPLIENGASKDINVRIIFEVSNTESVTLNTNPSVIIATKEDINNLQEQIENNDSQMKDCAKKDDLDNAINKLDKSKYNREAVAIDPASDLLTFPPGHFRVEGKISQLQNYPINRDWIHATVEISGFMNDDTHQGYKVIIFTTNNGDVYMNTQTWDADKWSGWKQLATIDDTGWITLPLIPPLVGYSDNVVPKYRKINNIVEVRGAIKGLKTLDATNGFNFSTLPVGFRPKHTIGVVCQGSALARWYLNVSSIGTLNIDRYSENGSAIKTEFNGLEWLPFQIMFSVD